MKRKSRRFAVIIRLRLSALIRTTGNDRANGCPRARYTLRRKTWDFVGVSGFRLQFGTGVSIFKLFKLGPKIIENLRRGRTARLLSELGASTERALEISV
jgi:hypothetical protein